jgi:hypothetical protein
MRQEELDYWDESEERNKQRKKHRDSATLHGELGAETSHRIAQQHKRGRQLTLSSPSSSGSLRSLLCPTLISWRYSRVLSRSSSRCPAPAHSRGFHGCISSIVWSLKERKPKAQRKKFRHGQDPRQCTSCSCCPSPVALHVEVSKLVERAHLHRQVLEPVVVAVELSQTRHQAQLRRQRAQLVP